MRSYEKQPYLKKNISDGIQKNSEKISKLHLQLIHQIFDTINISLLVLIFILFFISLDSQKKWTNTYKTLSKTKVLNNNLIDYISKTEQFYISELDSLKTYRKTKPKDLIYLERIAEKKESIFKKSLNSLIQGFSDSKYQRGF